MNTRSSRATSNSRPADSSRPISASSTRPGSRPASRPTGRNGSRSIDHPIGERPSIAFAGPIDVYQERQGVLAIIIEYTRLAHFLAQLEVGRTGTAFIFDGSGELIAAPDKDADELHPATQRQEAMLPLARMALTQAGDDGRKEAWRRRLTSDGRGL